MQIFKFAFVVVMTGLFGWFSLGPSDDREPATPHNACYHNKTSYECCVGWDKYDVCADLEYLEKSKGVRVDLKINNYTLISEEISVRNPPEICAVVPFVPELKNLIKVCLRFYDMQISAHEFSGCLEANFILISLKMKKIKIGCFDFGRNESDGSITHDFMIDFAKIKQPLANFYDYWRPSWASHCEANSTIYNSSSISNTTSEKIICYNEASNLQLNSLCLFGTFLWTVIKTDVLCSADFDFYMLPHASKINTIPENVPLVTPPPGCLPLTLY